MTTGDGEDEKPISGGWYTSDLFAKIVLSQARRRAPHRRHSSLAKARLGPADYYPFSFPPPLPLPLSIRNALIAIVQVARGYLWRGGTASSTRTENVRSIWKCRIDAEIPFCRTSGRDRDAFEGLLLTIVTRAAHFENSPIFKSNKYKYEINLNWTVEKVKAFSEPTQILI